MMNGNHYTFTMGLGDTFIDVDRNWPRRKCHVTVSLGGREGLNTRI